MVWPKRGARGAFSLGLHVARQGLRGPRLAEAGTELSSPASFTADCTAENSGDTPCCSSTFSSGHFCTGTSPDEHLGPCTDRPGPSLLEKPESSSGRRGRSGQPKGARMTKSYKKSK